MKRRFAVVIVLSFFLSLVATMPTYAVQGTVAILGPTGNAISSSQQGSSITLQVTDGDLNVPLKRVLIPGVDTGTNVSQTITATAGSTSVTISGDLTGTLAAGDTFVITSVGTSERVKKVANITSTTITTTTPFTSSFAAGTTIAKVTTVGAYAANCPDCTIAPSTALLAVTTANITLPDFPQLDTGIGSSLANRFSSVPDTLLNKLDVAIVDSAGGNIPSVTANTLDATNGVLNYTNSGSAVATAYILYWTGVADTVGISEKPASNSRVYVKSTADAAGIGVILAETGTNAGVFRRTITLTSAASVANTSLQVLATDVVTLYYNDANGSLVSTTMNVSPLPTPTATATPTPTPTPIAVPAVSGPGLGTMAAVLAVGFVVAGFLLRRQLAKRPNGGAALKQRQGTET